MYFLKIIISFDLLKFHRFVPNLAANSEPYLVTYNAGTDTLRIEKR